MDIPQVQISGLDNSHGPGDAQKAETRDVDMDSSQHAAATNDSITQEVPLSSATTELEQTSMEEVAPPKRNPGLQFLDSISDGTTSSFFPLFKDLQLTLFRYLTSPIVELTIGNGETKTTLTAHQRLLLESPFLAERVSVFDSSGPVG